MVHRVGMKLRLDYTDPKTGVRGPIAEATVYKVKKIMDNRKVCGVIYYLVSVKSLVREEDFPEDKIPREIDNKDSEWTLVNIDTLKTKSIFIRY